MKKRNILNERLKDAVNKFIKSVKAEESADMKWYDDELHKQRIKKDLSYKIATILSTGMSWRRFKSERNKYTAMMRLKRKEKNILKVNLVMLLATVNKHGEY